MSQPQGPSKQPHGTSAAGKTAADIPNGAPSQCLELTGARVLQGAPAEPGVVAAAARGAGSTGGGGAAHASRHHARGSCRGPAQAEEEDRR